MLSLQIFPMEIEKIAHLVLLPCKILFFSSVAKLKFRRNLPLHFALDFAGHFLCATNNTFFY